MTFAPNHRVHAWFVGADVVSGDRSAIDGVPAVVGVVRMRLASVSRGGHRSSFPQTHRDAQVTCGGMSDFRTPPSSDLLVRVLIGFGAFWGIAIPVIGAFVAGRSLVVGDAPYPVRAISLLVVMITLLVLRALVVITYVQRSLGRDAGGIAMQRQILASRLSWIVALLGIAGFGVIGVVKPLTPLDFVISGLAFAGAVAVAWRLVARMRRMNRDRPRPAAP